MKGLLTHQKGETLKTMLGILDHLGYRADYQNAIPVNLAYHIGCAAVATLRGETPTPMQQPEPKNRQLTIPGLNF